MLKMTERKDDANGEFLFHMAKLRAGNEINDPTGLVSVYLSHDHGGIVKSRSIFGTLF